MNQFLVRALRIALAAAMLCQVVEADPSNMNVLIKVKAPELSGLIRAKWARGPVAGATAQLCEKGWKNCALPIAIDTSGKFVFAATKPKRINYLLIMWPGAQSVTAEVKIDKKAKPLVIEMHPE
jgi:hypothetical protein